MEPITVFEHQTLRFEKNDPVLTALQKYYGNGVPYYSLCHNGVKFNEYVGVIQVGKTLIEVLPKADKDYEDKTVWRNILIGMVRAVSGFEVKSTGNSSLKIKPNTILDLYFEIFLSEVEYLLQTGLTKKYRKQEANVYALKGALQFSKQIQKNLTHQERFFVRHTTYDVEHLLHFIIHKTIRTLKQINTNSDLHGRIGALTLNFPEMPDIKVTENTFEKLVFNRKTLDYEKCINIAKMILLNYHPDISKGRHDVLALMFDMNKLWEQFVYVSLRKNMDKDSSVKRHKREYFWKPETGRISCLEPDIVFENSENIFVLDTKWKNPGSQNPSPEDLRQMYAYHDYFSANRVALIYPGQGSFKKGVFIDPETKRESEKECSVITIPVEKDIQKWQKAIKEQILENLNI
jgi:5-methylcytosine-specific restriction enzyme subunit McrC